MINEYEIRKHWFPSHVAELRTLRGLAAGEQIQMLHWRKPQTFCYAVDYTLIGRTLVVTGDVGDATYWWSEAHGFKWIANCDLGYFASKCRASETGRLFRCWDPDKAQRRLKEYIARSGELSADLGGQLVDVDELRKNVGDRAGFSAVHNRDEWMCWLQENGDKVFGEGWYHELPEIGDAIHPRCHGHLVGLKMACEQLEAAK